ncbi:PQQ-binding-like beta-propeller repeat protein [Ammoniphilus sp. CFH 90114]|uniref:outer membrane protein assembly factor BamB family protein n=1 Tax=Ammoniphilus sp. CFH 90114 TaxID=2493665 RepID=UPI0013E93884|nr:PQQ-binding-like beta-propeller repeat protein [Ammoniphilus sp. CFH 90114]
MKKQSLIILLSVMLGTTAADSIYAADEISYTSKPIQQWSYQIQGSYSQHIQTLAFGPDGTIYAGTLGSPAKTVDDGELYALQPNGKVKWSLHLGPNWTTPTIGKDGTIYTLSYGDLKAISPDGKIKWTYQGGEFGLEMARPTVGSDNTIYVVRRENTFQSLVALTPDGKEKWKATPEDAHMGYITTPVLGKDGTLYGGINGQGKKSIYALNPDGTTKWSFTGEGPTHKFLSGISLPAIGEDGTLYVGMSDGYVYALGEDGKAIWSYQTNQIQHTAPVFDTEGNLYLVGAEMGGKEEILYSITPEGKLRWSTANKLEVRGFNGVTLHDQSIYIQGQDGKIIRLTLDGNVSEDQAAPQGTIGGLTFHEDGFLLSGDNKLTYYANRFTDIPNTHWIFRNGTIQWAAKTEVSEGYPDGRFQPEKAVTEAEFITLFIHSYEEENGFQLNPMPGAAWNEPFYKVLEDMLWNVPGLTTLSQRSQPMTRGAVAVLVAEAVSGKKMSEQEAVMYLLNHKLASGRTAEASIDSYVPKGTLTRAEAIQFIRNVKEKGIVQLKKVEE